MQAAPAEKSAIGRYRLLSPSAAVKVSPLCIGAMNFGEAWGAFMGHMPKKEVFEFLDYYHGQGGNFVDTANNYQAEESELLIGEWMHSRGLRDEMVIATKFTTCFTAHQGFEGKIHANTAGNSTKSLHVSLKHSLRKLKTDYIDILYVHWWDFTVSIPELMKSLNTVCDQGKVLYLGISDTPAWIVSKANQYARDHGLRQFVVYQGQWSAANRDFERDIIPMCVSEGMGLAPWGALGGGNFKTKAQREALGKQGRQMPPSPTHEQVTEVLDRIATAKSTAITSVALAYVMHKTPYVFPIIGGRTIDHLKSNIDALNLSLSAEDIAAIEAAYPFDLGFPMNFLGGTQQPSNGFLVQMSGQYDYVQGLNPITPLQVAETKNKPNPKAPWE